jgi:hypothetical protein
MFVILNSAFIMGLRKINIENYYLNNNFKTLREEKIKYSIN